MIFHGTADKTVPYEDAAAFRDAMVAAGNACRLHGYAGQWHAFFNKNRGRKYFTATLRETAMGMATATGPSTRAKASRSARLKARTAATTP